MSRVLSWVLLIAAVVASPVRSAEPEPSSVGPMPGEPAPPLVVSKWVRGGPVGQFKPGRLYIVDLWATWCAPCRSSMPILRAIQDGHAEDVTVVAMNVWEMNPKGVPAFVKSFADSMPVHVATDSVPSGKEANEGLTAVAYLGSSEFVSIPRTFLIDRTGKIAWVGTPPELEQPLAQALAGTWDLAGFAEGYAREMRKEARYRGLFGPVEPAIQAREWERAYQACEDVAAADSSFRGRVAHQGFCYLAMAIMELKAPSVGESAMARRAAERALALSDESDWPLYLVAADAAKASGDLESARGYLKTALEHAPGEERMKIQATVDSLPPGK